MSTLLLRLSAPLQSWGVGSKFDRRDTGIAPTKSGVIGMIASALGMRRDEPPGELNCLRFGVRTDWPGTLMRDFHMAHQEKFWQTHAGNYAHLTHRYYLCDALFLTGLEGNDELLEKISTALIRPAFPLFLGRRSCPPEGKLVLGIRKGVSLEASMAEEPWLVAFRRGKERSSFPKLRVFIESDASDPKAYLQRDLTLSFDQARREHGFRLLRETTVLPGREAFLSSVMAEGPTEHDPMLELEG